MNEISFFVELTPNANNRIRVKAFKETGKILSFVVQCESKIKGSWKAIVRYDTAHSFGHRDILHPDGTQSKQPLFFGTFNEAFTFALNELKVSWKSYLNNYISEMKS